MTLVADPWRLSCPHGHRSVTTSGSVRWRCEVCEEYYTELLDNKTGRRVSRSEVTP
jgi:thiamine biosynthesis lipoprotein ApbE